METFIFKYGQQEFICQAGSRAMAQFQADTFIAKDSPIDQPYGWVSDSEGPNIFRISMGA